MILSHWKDNFLEVAVNSSNRLFYDFFDVCSTFYKFEGSVDVKTQFLRYESLEGDFPHFSVKSSDHLFHDDFDVCRTFLKF